MIQGRPESDCAGAKPERRETTYIECEGCRVRPDQYARNARPSRWLRIFAMRHGSSCLQDGVWEAASPSDLAAPAAACSHWTSAKRCAATTSRLFNYKPSHKKCNGPWWQPAALNRASFASALKGRTLRFIGDSVTADYYKYLTRCVLGCESNATNQFSLAHGSTRDLYNRSITVAGYDSDAAFWAINILRPAAGKEPYELGCALEGGGRVDFRRVNSLPDMRPRPGRAGPQAVLGAVLHSLLYLPEPPLRSDDIAMLSFGLHRDIGLGVKMAAVLRWWESEGTRAPRLVWRQSSPQHWPLAPLGSFRGFDDVLPTATHGCRADGLMEDAFAHYDLNVSALVLEARNRHGRRWADVLDVFAASWPRAEDHPRLTEGSLPLHSLASRFGTNMTKLTDCTHWCIPGSLYRFYTQAIGAWLAENERG